MKIYVLANTVLLESAISGGDIILPRVARNWDNGNEITVITDKIGQKLWQRNNVKTRFLLTDDYFLKKYQSLIYGPLKYFIRTIQAVKLLNYQLKKDEEVAIVYTSSDFFPDVIPAFLARKKYSNTKWLARVYHFIQRPRERQGNIFANIFSYFSQRFGLKLIKKSADRIVALTGAYDDLISFGISRKRIVESNAGVEIEKIARLKSTNNHYEAVSVGNLTPTRGANDLIDIWAMVVDKMPQAKLAIIGGGAPDFINRWKKNIKEKNLEKNIDYYGFLKENKAVYRLLKASKLYLHTAHEGGWSLPITEAMAAGTPAVSYQLPLMEKSFTKSTTTVPLYDQNLFAKKIINLLNNNNKRKKLAHLAEKEVKKYSWRSVAEDLNSIMHQMVSND